MGCAVLACGMVRARIFLALALLAAAFVSAAILPDSAAAAPVTGCADAVCIGAPGGDGCPACKGEPQRSDRVAADACAALCAVMTAVLPAPARIVLAAPATGERLARPVPSGTSIAPERAPPRPSIPA